MGTLRSLAIRLGIALALPAAFAGVASADEFGMRRVVNSERHPYDGFANDAEELSYDRTMLAQNRRELGAARVELIRDEAKLAFHINERRHAAHRGYGYEVARLDWVIVHDREELTRDQSRIAWLENQDARLVHELRSDLADARHGSFYR
jgi:hypothetical protein